MDSIYHSRQARVNKFTGRTKKMLEVASRALNQNLRRQSTLTHRDSWSPPVSTVALTVCHCSLSIFRGKSTNLERTAAEEMRRRGQAKSSCLLRCRCLFAPTVSLHLSDLPARCCNYCAEHCEPTHVTLNIPINFKWWSLVHMCGNWCHILIRFALHHLKLIIARITSVIYKLTVL